MKHAAALVAALLLNASANLLMKVGMNAVRQGGGVLRDGIFGAVGIVLSNTQLVVGLFLFALNALFYLYALQSPALKISIAYPIMVGGGYAIIAVVAHYHPALLEVLTLGQKLGVALILIGVLLVALTTEPHRAPTPL